MLKTLATTLLGATALFAAGAGAAQAQTVKVLIVAEDYDPHAIERNNRIQRSVLTTFSETLHSPHYKQMMQRYGIDGMDVYDETAVSLYFYDQSRRRRSDAELISLSRQIRNPQIDVAVLYTLYARAVQDPYTHISKLQMSMTYRALDVRSGRFFGGDNLDIDTSGIPFEGCATALHGVAPDEHCVKEFVAAHGEKLARDAANVLALKLAALLGKQYGSSGAYDTSGYNPDDNSKIGDADGYVPEGEAVAPTHTSVVTGGGHCPNVPTTFAIKYEGFSSRQLTFIETNMAQWKCALDLDSLDASFSHAAYEYKTRANEGQTLRNIRLMLDLAGVVADTRTVGPNKIVVRSVGLRSN